MKPGWASTPLVHTLEVSKDEGVEGLAHLLVPTTSNDADLSQTPSKVGALKTTDVGCRGLPFRHADRGRRGMDEEVLEVSGAAKNIRFPHRCPIYHLTLVSYQCTRKSIVSPKSAL